MGTSLYDRYQQEQGGGESLYAKYQREKGPQATPRESLKLDVRQPSESTAALPSNRPDRDSNFAGLPSDAGATVAGLVATAGQAVPGMERVQALVRAGVRRQPYREALSDMRAVTDPIPGPIKFAAQLPVMAGGASALGKIPGRIGALMQSPAKAGAVIGAADQALSADEMSPIARGVRTASAGLLGSIIGKGADIGITGSRAIAAKSPGTNVIGRKAAMEAADVANYGAAGREGAAAVGSGMAGPASPVGGVSAALSHPDIKPFADMVRSARQFAGADEPTVLRETFKLMSKQQGGLAQSLKRDGFDAAKKLQHDNIGLAKEELLSAADQLGPAFRKAVRAHAGLAREIEAVGTGAAAAQRVVGADATGKRIGTQSREAYANTIKKMPPNEQAPAIEGVLGALKKRIGLQPNLVSAGGSLTSAIRPAKVASFLRAVGDPRTRRLDEVVRGGLLGATSLEELLGH